jgi:hypothetical protein
MRVRALARARARDRAKSCRNGVGGFDRRRARIASMEQMNSYIAIPCRHIETMSMRPTAKARQLDDQVILRHKLLNKQGLISRGRDEIVLAAADGVVIRNRLLANHRRF